jgi:hypothetical protein
VRQRGAQVGGRLLPVGVALAVAGRRMFQVVLVALRSGAAQLLAMLARLGALVRRRMPGAREALARIARTMLLFASAYASEIRRVVKAEWTEFAVWLAARRRGPEPDGPPVVELLPPADSEPDAAAEAARRRTG